MYVARTNEKVLPEERRPDVRFMDNDRRVIERILLPISQKKMGRSRIEFLSRRAISVFDGIGQQTEFIQARTLVHAQDRIRERLVPRFEHIGPELERLLV